MTNKRPFTINKNVNDRLFALEKKPYGEPLWKPEMKEGNPIRLYTIMYLNYAKQCDIFKLPNGSLNKTNG